MPRTDFSENLDFVALQAEDRQRLDHAVVETLGAADHHLIDRE